MSDYISMTRIVGVLYVYVCIPQEFVYIITLSIITMVIMVNVLRFVNKMLFYFLQILPAPVQDGVEDFWVNYLLPTSRVNQYVREDQTYAINDDDILKVTRPPLVVERQRGQFVYMFACMMSYFGLILSIMVKQCCYTDEHEQFRLNVLDE